MSEPNVLMVGTGEYTTGYVHDAPSASDKSAGVVALTLFDLRRRGLVGDLKMVGTRGTKFPGIRRHIQQAVAGVYRDLDTDFQSFPPDDVPHDPRAYRTAMRTMSPSDIVIIFTPDDTHFQIAQEAVLAGCHTLIAKPIVKTIDEHRGLMRCAAERGVLVAMEVHKRWDPIYLDARDRIRQLGEFSFFSSYMSQPKSQLSTFRDWAGRSSDISYYLNAHHIDFHVWSVAHMARPVRVRASCSTGVARSMGIDTEDLITLTVDWQNMSSGEQAAAIYTASWIAPKSDVHSQQRFFYVGHHGELSIDQAHRGYSIATDKNGFASPNPLFMKYAPDADGRFSGQTGYGYRSIEAFVSSARAMRDDATPGDFRGKLATIDDTLLVTAILEAGRKSLDRDGHAVRLHYGADDLVEALVEE